MDVKKYFAQQDADIHIAPNSRNRRLMSLRVMVEWAVEQGMLDYDPTVSVKRVYVEVSPRDRDSGEMSRLDAVAEQGLHIRCAGNAHAWLALRDRVIWALFRDTRLRDP